MRARGECGHSQCCQHPDVFEEICIASSTLSKCEAIKKKLDGGKTKIQIAQLDADQTQDVISLIQSFQPDIVINVALPYQDLTIMDACLATGVDFLDTANYEPPDVPKFEYKWQWAYKDRYEKAGITALLGSGFDPGVTSVFVAYAQKHYFDEILRSILSMQMQGITGIRLQRTSIPKSTFGRSRRTELL